MFSRFIVPLLLLASAGVAAASSSAPLNAKELAAVVQVDAVSIPTPAELMAALNKVGKPNWQSRYRQPIPTNFASRAQIALNLGGLIADGYIAVEAEDAQQVKNTGKDIIALAKCLAVSESVIARGNSIFEFAERNEWNTLKEELEATQNEVKLSLEQQHDTGLVSLVSLGAWIRGTEIISGWIAENYTAPAAKLLRQPEIVALMQAKLDQLPPKAKEDPLVADLIAQLPELQAEVSFPNDKTPTQNDVKAVQETSAKLMKRIATKLNGKEKK
ncbi:MAG: hypothetical protein WCH57_09025 [Verrucomicrobiota bacterium]